MGKALNSALRLVQSLAFLVVIGTLAMKLPWCGQERTLTWIESLFTTVSALSTTGLSIINPGKDLSYFGQVVLMVLMQLGGIGYMTMAVTIFMMLGRDISLQDRITLRDSLGLISAASLLKLVRHIVVGVLTIEALGMLVLWIIWTPYYGSGLAAYLAMWHSVSAFCGVSMDLFSGLPATPDGFPKDSATLIAIPTLVILGSVGIPVLSELISRKPRKRWSLHTRLTLRVVAALLLGGTFILFIGFSHGGDLFGKLPWPRRLLMAWFHSAAARTSGFALEDLSQMATCNALVLGILMFIGGSPASMSGGITTGTLSVVILSLNAQIRGRAHVAWGGRHIPAETVNKAFAILTLALIFCSCATWLILITQKSRLTESAFEVVSAFATCGFTLGLTPRLDLVGQLIIIFTMFCGRLGALTAVIAMTRHETSLVSYPEEKVLLG